MYSAGLEFLASFKIRTKQGMVRPVAGLIYKLRFHFLVADAVCKRHLTTSGSGVLDFLANKAYYKPLESKSCGLFFEHPQNSWYLSGKLSGP